MSYAINRYNGANPRYNVVKGKYKRKYIVVHYTGSGTAYTPNIAKNNCIYFSSGNRNASADYFIDDASIWQFNDPSTGYTWHVGDGGGRYKPDGKVAAVNSNCIGIEVASKGADFTDGEKRRLRFLVRKLMDDYGIDAKHVIRHYDASRKTCPRPYSGCTANDRKWKALHEYITDATVVETESKPKLLTAADIKGKSDQAVITKLAHEFQVDMVKSSVLASVSMAQFCLESNYGQSELAQNANNYFGMKKSLSGNAWPGSTWDGSIYKKQTKEQKSNGQYVTITADFRKYPCILDSISDHSAYLLGAMNGTKKRYAGLKDCADYEKALSIIKAGGYATSHDYAKNTCNVVKKWHLDQYDLVPGRDYKMLMDTNVRTGRSSEYKVVDKAEKGMGIHVYEFKVDKNGKIWANIGHFRWLVVSTEKHIRIEPLR